MPSLHTSCRLAPVMLPRFAVRSMLAAKTTIFLEFKSIRGTTLIFCRSVVTAFALITRQDHQLPHSIFLSLRQDITDDTRAHRAPALPNGKAQLLL
jgi:hypothetical protein